MTCDCGDEKEHEHLSFSYYFGMGESVFLWLKQGKVKWSIEGKVVGKTSSGRPLVRYEFEGQTYIEPVNEGNCWFRE